MIYGEDFIYVIVDLAKIVSLNKSVGIGVILFLHLQWGRLT